MRIAAISALMALLIHPPAAAQMMPMAAAADSVLIRNRIFHELFGGLKLNMDQERLARLEIARTDRLQARLLPIVSSAGWAELIALQDMRDSILRAIVVDSSARLVFDKRAAKMRPKPRPAGALRPGP